MYLVSSYSLAENTDDGKYDAVQFTSQRYISLSSPAHMDVENHGPAKTIHDTGIESSVDTVGCVRHLSWPTQAADWPTRHRNYDWPDSATVDHVVSNGCDVVCVAHRLCRQDEWMNKRQFRLSFSRAEIVLLNS